MHNAFFLKRQTLKVQQLLIRGNKGFGGWGKMASKVGNGFFKPVNSCKFRNFKRVLFSGNFAEFCENKTPAKRRIHSAIY